MISHKKGSSTKAKLFLNRFSEKRDLIWNDAHVDVCSHKPNVNRCF